MTESNRARKKKSQVEKEIVVVRKARVHKGDSGLANTMKPRVASKSAPEPLELRLREASQSKMTFHITRKRRARKAPKRVPIRRAFIETSEIEDQSRVREKTPKRDIIVSKAETEVTYNENEGSQPSPENRIIKTSSLRRFASEKLPSSSVLREVLMAENEKLTAEEFLAKLDIWLHLFKRDIGG